MSNIDREFIRNMYYDFITALLENPESEEKITAFVEKLCEFTEVWAENYPANPEIINKKEKEIKEWLKNY